MQIRAWSPAWVLSALILVAGGCSSHLGVKPAPVIYAPGKIDYTSVVPESERSNDISVFYATTRTGKGPADNRQYNNGVSDKLALGVATVRVGDAKSDWNAVASASNGTGADPKFVFQRAAELDQAAFVAAVNQQLAESPNGQVNIYVHGFHTEIKQEIEVMAKFLHYAGRRGAMIVFGWPSRQSLVLYNSDSKRGLDSAGHLADLIELVATKTNAKQINFLGYSAGGAIVASALVQVRQRHADDDLAALAKQMRVGNVVMAACDLDLQSFAKDQIYAVKDLAQNLVVYVSNDDMAMKMAGMGFGGSKLGRPNVKELKLTKDEMDRAAANQRLQVIDVTDVPGPKESGGGLAGHGYWYANSWVMTDVLVTLRWQVPAEERGLVRPEGKTRWIFPKDYPDRVTAAVQRMLATPADKEQASTAASPQ